MLETKGKKVTHILDTLRIVTVVYSSILSFPAPLICTDLEVDLRQEGLGAMEIQGRLWSYQSEIPSQGFLNLE